MIKIRHKYYKFAALLDGVSAIDTTSGLVQVVDYLEKFSVWEAHQKVQFRNPLQSDDRKIKMLKPSIMMRE